MSILERVRSHPARYLLPNSMTLARPVLGWKALRAARSGDWARAQKFLIPALASDLEGIPARALEATSTAGAKGDPLADGVLRAEGIVMLAPHMNILTTAILIAGEGINLALNLEDQKGNERPDIPKAAKRGAVVQAVGAGIFTEGMKRQRPMYRFAGQALLIAGTGIRVHAYAKVHSLKHPNKYKVELEKAVAASLAEGKKTARDIFGD